MSSFLDNLPHGWRHINGNPANHIIGEIAFRQEDNAVHVKTDRNVQIGAWHIVGKTDYILYPDHAVERCGGVDREVPREIEDYLRLAVDQPRSITG